MPRAMAAAVYGWVSMVWRIAFSNELAVRRAAVPALSITSAALSRAWPYTSCAASVTAPATPLAFFRASSRARLKSVAFVEVWAMAFPLAVKVAGDINARVPVRFSGWELFSSGGPQRNWAQSSCCPSSRFFRLATSRSSFASRSANELCTSPCSPPGPGGGSEVQLIPMLLPFRHATLA